jgi:LemA protein
MSPAIIIIVAVVIIAAIVIISMYNKMVTLRQRVKNAWSQIDIQLKQRFDMIPNLVNIVKGYAKHESETLEAVIAARNKYSAAETPKEQIEAANAIEGTISKLFALAEAYPDLKANQNFLSLQNDLKSIEDKITYSRQFYNDTAMKFNTYILKFPINLFHVEPADYFKGEDEIKAAPKIEF